MRWACAEAKRLGKPVIYVPGNHEYYGGELRSKERAMREIGRCEGGHVLNNDSIEFGRVRFLGTTLWTDYKTAPYGSTDDAMPHSKRVMADHSVIRVGDRKFHSRDALALHRESLAWLKSELADETDSITTVVIPHHAPPLRCRHPQFGLDLTSGAFLSDLDDVVAKADAWFYGHTHSCLDQRVRGARVVSNARGYPYERTFGFTPDKLVDVSRKESGPSGGGMIAPIRRYKKDPCRTQMNMGAMRGYTPEAFV